jgi:putative ABC transport system permease protein
MLLWSLAIRSLRNRALTSFLTVTSIALSVALLVGVENVRVGMRESFSGTISGTDLIVGARGGTTQLLLYSVFGLGSPTQNVSFQTYEKWANHPAVAWTIPYSLGDSHRGFRVIGTTDSFFEHFRYRQGTPLTLARGERLGGVFDVVLGSEVASSLGYSVGDNIVLAHGIGSVTFIEHDNLPFTIVGILARTSTPVDRAVYTSMEGIEALHVDWRQGAPPMPGMETPVDEVLAMDLSPTQITSFLLGANSRVETLRLQREVNTDQEEALTAIIPGVTLAEMWRTVGYAEQGLVVVTVFVLLVGLLGMLVSLYTSLEARRREMAIFRAVGAGPGRILSLLVFESGLLATLGAILGVGLVYLLIVLAQAPVESRFGLFIPLRPLGAVEMVYLAGVVVAGFLIGLIPAWKAYRNTLADGLSLRV